MPDYTTRLLTLRFGGRDLRIRALSDLQQYADPDGAANRAGISSANWSLFGQVWPSSKVLAQAMVDIPLEGRRVLELGCGLGLATLVLMRRGADVTASDHHPLAEDFLAHNAALNGLPPPRYRDLPWADDRPLLGQFGLIIGSDLLYERGQAETLARLVSRHALPACQVLITDPGRGNSGAFSTALGAQGFALHEVRSAFDDGDLPPYRGRLLSFQR